jgi:hypothetical protein
MLADDKNLGESRFALVDSVISNTGRGERSRCSLDWGVRGTRIKYSKNSKKAKLKQEN